MNVPELLAQQWQQQSGWEVAAVLLAVAYVWLAARQSIWCWPSAFVSTGIYTWLFWEHSLPLQSALNGYYLLMAVYGWWHWQAMRTESPVAVVQKPLSFHLVIIAGLSITSFIIANSLTSSFASEHVYLDAVVTIFSLFTTWLVTQKVLENWLYWIVIDLLAGYLYWQIGLYLTAILFVGYFGFSLYGYWQWKKTLVTEIKYA